MLTFMCFALLPAAFAVVLEPQSTLDCKTNYDLANSDFSKTAEDRCTDLVEFSKCLSAFPPSVLMESQLFQQNQKNCEQNWKATGAPEVRTRRGNLQMSVDDAKQVTFFRHRREEVSVFKMNEQISALEAQVAKIAQLTDGKLALAKKVSDADAAATKTQLAADIAQLKKDNAAAALDQKTKLQAVQTGVANDITKAASITDGKLALAKKVSDAAAAATKTQLAAVAKQSLEPAPVHMWSGSPKSHARGSGWSDFTLDRVDFDMSAPYFKRLSNTRFQALQSGYFHFSLDSMAHTGGRGQKHFQFYVNNKHINGNTHFYTYGWAQITYEVTWFIKKGEQFYGRQYASGSNAYRYHHGNNWVGAYTRIQISYKGQKPSASVVKCTGQVCPP